MKIQYVDRYTNYGCHFVGNLAVVDHIEKMNEIASKQPLEGFGQGACFDSLDEARELLKSGGGEG